MGVCVHITEHYVVHLKLTPRYKSSILQLTKIHVFFPPFESPQPSCVGVDQSFHVLAVQGLQLHGLPVEGGSGSAQLGLPLTTCPSPSHLRVPYGHRVKNHYCVNPFPLRSLGK